MEITEDRRNRGLEEIEVIEVIEEMDGMEELEENPLSLPLRRDVGGE